MAEILSECSQIGITGKKKNKIQINDYGNKEYLDRTKSKNRETVEIQPGINLKKNHPVTVSQLKYEINAI